MLSQRELLASPHCRRERERETTISVVFCSKPKENLEGLVREGGRGDGMLELSNSHTVHTRTTDLRKHKATPTASILSS